jgi:hypothetical protein
VLCTAMDVDPAEKAKAARVQRLLYLIMVLLILSPLVVLFLRSR